MDADCKLHTNQIENLESKMTLVEDDLKMIRKNLHTLLGRQNDIIVKVINGKTEERLASELIGEMYVEMKSLKKQTPKSILSSGVIPIINLLTIISLIIAILAIGG